MSKKKKILICIDKIKNLNSGLGRVSIEFANEIINTNNFDYSFLVPSNYEGDNFNGHEVIKLSILKKYFSGYMRKFDLVHLLYQSPKYSYSKARKILMTIHDINFIHVKSDAKKVKYQKKMQKSIDKSDALCFISEFSMTDTNSYLEIDDKKVQKVIYNGVSKMNNTFEKPSWCPEKYLFSIGIFTEKKNFHTLIPFIEELKGDQKLVIAGDSDTSYGRKVKADIEKSNLSNKVILPGMISEAEKNYLYNNCDAFIFPSLAEGFGLPIIEAMRFGKPVFCSDKTSLKEIGNKHVYFWENFSLANMVSVFRDGMDDFSIKKQEEEIAYANFFTWERNVKEYINYYKTLLNE